jgi:hypothetical protein
MSRACDASRDAADQFAANRRARPTADTRADQLCYLVVIVVIVSLCRELMFNVRPVRPQTMQTREHHFLCKGMGSNLRAKGWTKTVWMQVAVVFAWFGGMFFSSVVYTFYSGFTAGEAGLENRVLSAYPLFLLAGAVAVGGVFFIASFFPSREPVYSSDYSPSSVRL